MLPVNFYFLDSNKTYNRDFFVIHTIDDGLSFYGIESALSSNIFGLVCNSISRKYDPIVKAS